MEQTLRILNELADQKLVESYAIGGALAAFFYSEGVVTEVLDAFVLIAPPPGVLLTLTPVYDYLKSRGAMEQREHLILAGTLVQVIPAYDKLTEEAVRQAVNEGLARPRRESLAPGFSPVSGGAERSTASAVSHPHENR